jgi:hypothetical protein
MSEHTQDAGTPVFTKSTDGYLVGGHPELGDTVYASDGNEIGKVGFFYDRIKDTDHYRVQIAGHAEDPVLVRVTPVLHDTIVIGARLVAIPGLAAKIGQGLQANVAIANNA